MAKAKVTAPVPVKVKKKAVKKATAPAARKATRKGAKKAARAAALPQVRVRMFRQGLGDCFLISFLLVDGDERHMLIDCGTLGNTGSTVEIEHVADHVLEIIDKSPRKKLDVVVATHEHKDHLSGFNGAKGMQRLKDKVEHVWLAWTENPSDPDAKTLAKNRRDLGAELAAMSQALTAADPNSVVASNVNGLLGFAGDEALGAKFAETIDAAMDFVRVGLNAKVAFHNPGDLIKADWLPGFRIYVLGPPRANASLQNTGEHGSGELYGIAGDLRRAVMSSLHAADSSRPNLTPEEQEIAEQQLPFDMRYIERGNELKLQRYPNYLAPAEAWRKVDDDWLSVASDLALQLDSATNNTSLALAIERVADGKVLLFPADAQEGSWLSWHDTKIKWKVPNPAGGESEVNAADLLARTVFYKTGHHGSHNATAKGQGLELMRMESELTAFIPVNRAVALTKSPKGTWQMPARPLYLRLLQKCQGRVARSDLGWAAEPTGKAAKDVEEKLVGLVDAKQWATWANAQAAAEKASQVKVEDLYIEYLLK